MSTLGWVGRRSSAHALSRGVALAVALACGAGFLAVYRALVHTAHGQAFDEQLFHLVSGLTPPLFAPPLGTFARVVSIPFLAAVVLVVGVGALRRRRWWAVAVSVLLVSVGAVASPLMRDNLLSRPQFTLETFPENSFPSTHTSVAAALVVAVVILWEPEPRRLRRAAVVMVSAVVVGNILSQAHRPSDVVGSLLLVTGTYWLLRAVHPVTPSRGAARPES